MNMNKFIFLLCFSFVLSGCEKAEYKYYHSRLYPVKNGNKYGEKNAFFKDVPISICLESRVDEEDYPSSSQGRFEYAIVNSADLSFDRDIVILGNTLQSGSNLLKTQYASIELVNTTLNGKPIPDYYVLWVNKENITDFYTNKGYYTVYFKAITERNYQINDSTVIFVE